MIRIMWLWLAIGILITLSFSTSTVYAAQEYKIIGNQFEFSNGDHWVITDGEISLQFFDVLPEAGFQRAVYGVTGFSINAVDLLGMDHTITVVPDGLPSPFFHDPSVPDIVQDSGLVNVFSDGFLDMIVYDLSLDGLPSVNPDDIIGGPAFVGSAWFGAFPEPMFFSVSMPAAISSYNLFGEVSLAAELVPEPSSLHLLAIAAIIIRNHAWQRRKRAG